MRIFTTCWDKWGLQGCYQLYQIPLGMLLALPMTVEHCSLLPLWKAVFGASAGPAQPASPGSDEWAPWFLRWSPAVPTCAAQQACSESACTCFAAARAAQGCCKSLLVSTEGSTLQKALQSVTHSHSHEGCTLLPVEFQKAKEESNLALSEHRWKHDENQEELTVFHSSPELKNSAG